MSSEFDSSKNFTLAEQSYDEWASWYPFIFGDAEQAIRLFRDTLEQTLVPHVEPGARVLDAACGTGLGLCALADLGYRATGVDISDGALAVARDWTAKRGHDVVLERVDLACPPDNLGTFDAVVTLSGFLDHFLSEAEQVDVLAKLSALIRPGGVLVLSHHDHARQLATDSDDVCIAPVARRDGNGEPFLYFERRLWHGEPRERAFEHRFYRINDDGSTACVTLNLRAMTMAEVEHALDDCGVATGVWHHPDETGFYQPVLVAERRTDADQARPAVSRVILPGAIKPVAAPPMPDEPVLAEDTSENPFEETPAFHRNTLRPGKSADGSPVLSRRRQVTLVMVSGGIDSVYALVKLLRESEDEVLAHHIHLKNRENRDRIEAACCQRIVKHARETYRPFHYTESTIDRRQFAAFGADDMAVAYEAGLVAQAFANERGQAVDRWFAGFCLEERLDEWGDAVAVQEHMLNACAAGAWPQLAPRYAVLPPIPKRDQMAYLGDDLAAMCWTCREPVWHDDGSVSECGVCKTCVLMNKIRAGEETIPTTTGVTVAQEAKPGVAADLR